jgi:hypothetical protein
MGAAAIRHVQGFADRHNANAARKYFWRAVKMAANSFDSPRGFLLSKDHRARNAHKVLERRNYTNRFGLVRVLCFILGGRGRVLRHSRPLADCACVPTISLFDPPTYVVASLADAIASLAEARPLDERTSTAAAPQGNGQDVW